MKKNENGSISAIVVVTVLFILMILGTYLTTISSKRKAQIQETLLLQEAYDGDMKNIYEEQLQKRSAIPSTYSDVLYIEASGTQSIYGLTLPDDYKLSVTASLEEGTDYDIFRSNVGAPELGINSNSKLEYKSAQNTPTVASEEYTPEENTVNGNITGVVATSEEPEISESSIDFNQKLTITNDCTGTNNVVLVNGAKVIESKKINNSTEITMFDGFKGKIYSVSIYDGDNLKYSLTPCYNKDTKKVGLYDNVGKKFYENNGIGSDFKAGPEI